MLFFFTHPICKLMKRILRMFISFAIGIELRSR